MTTFTIIILIILVLGIIWLAYLNISKNKSAEILKQQIKTVSDSSLTFSTQLEYQRQACEKLTKELKTKCQEYETKIIKLVGEHADAIKSNRKDAVTSQKSIVKGQINENLAVLLPCWKWKVSDSRFLGGSPLDFIVYPGLSEENISEIILVDVKTGGAQLNTRQRQIKKAIENGKVSFETIRIE